MKLVNEYKAFLQEKSKQKPSTSCYLSYINILNMFIYVVFDKIKRNTNTGEVFIKEIIHKYGKFDTYNFIKGNFLQVHYQYHYIYKYI